MTRYLIIKMLTAVFFQNKIEVAEVYMNAPFTPL